MVSKYSLAKIKNLILRRKGQKRNESINEVFRKKGMKIGDNCKIFSNISTTESYLVEIGNNVTISTNVKLVTHDNSICKIDDNYTDIFGKIIINDNCFLGANTLILPGVSLAKNIIVGAGSVVTKSFSEEGIVIAGNPAKKINTIENIKEKVNKYGVNIRNMTPAEKRKCLLDENKLIKK